MFINTRSWFLGEAFGKEENGDQRTQVLSPRQRTKRLRILISNNLSSSSAHYIPTAPIPDSSSAEGHLSLI